MIKQSKPVLFDQDVLHNFCVEQKLQPFREKQILYEVFKNQNIGFEDMTTLSKDLRGVLSAEFKVLSLECVETLEEEATTKFAFQTWDGYVIETVLMFHRSKHEKEKLNRITICLSCQIGCSVGCSFCVTWQLGIKRNLMWQEMISQILYTNWYIKKKFGKKEDGTFFKVRNVVFMWMGEPLLNYDNLKKTFPYLLEQNRLSLSRRHITISTCGIITWIQKLIDDKIPVKLAVSLHAPNQELREKLIPIARTNRLDDLMNILGKYMEVTNNRIFYEYIMIQGVTDMSEIAEELADLLRGQLAHVNLIPYNQNPAIDFEESSVGRIRNFKKILEDRGVTVTIRDSMGREVRSACGQLGYDKVENK